MQTEDQTPSATPAACVLDRPVGRLVPERTAQQYADVAPSGYWLLGDDEPAGVGDVAYIGYIGGAWRSVRRGMNIAGAALEDLRGSGVLALARRKPPNSQAEQPARAKDER